MTADEIRSHIVENGAICIIYAVDKDGEWIMHRTRGDSDNIYVLPALCRSAAEITAAQGLTSHTSRIECADHEWIVTITRAPKE